MRFVCVRMCVMIAAEIDRVSSADLAPLRPSSGAGLFFSGADNMANSEPGSCPGTYLVFSLLLDPCDRVQKRLSHEIGEAFLARCSCGDEPAFVVGRYADRDLGRLSVIGGFLDSRIL